VRQQQKGGETTNSKPLGPIIMMSQSEKTLWQRVQLCRAKTIFLSQTKPACFGFSYFQFYCAGSHTYRAPLAGDALRQAMGFSFQVKLSTLPIQKENQLL
jgi:hypothetical protein